MAGKKATRNAYGEAIAELGAVRDDIVVLDADLSGSTMTKGFAAEYPERFFDCGIAEANMTGIAAGMAAAGLKPFINSFAMFSSGRNYEQVRNSIAYPGLSVVVVGSHGGVSVGEDGATHQCIEDFALMRVIPGMLVCCPCDANEMKYAVKALADYDGPAYLRLQRPATEVFTDEIEGYEFKLGKAVKLRDGSDVTIAATGIMVYKAMLAADILSAEGIEAEVLNIHTIKPIDENAIIASASKTGCVLTVEEHSVIGGLGGAVAEVLSEKCNVPLIRHGVRDVFGRSGTVDAVLNYFGLNPETIAEKAKEAIAKKK